MKKIPVLLLLLIGLVYSCERDDICPESTATTPRLIIEFNDITNLEDSKNVRQLTVIGIDDEGNDIRTLISRTTTNQLALPLKIVTEGENNTSRFKLIRDADFDIDNNASTASNTDVITITYLPEFVYVNRACGFKSIFNSISIEVENDDDQWVLGQNTNIENIENELNAHITLFH
jgi:hypothetical protein